MPRKEEGGARIVCIAGNPLISGVFCWEDGTRGGGTRGWLCWGPLAPAPPRWATVLGWQGHRRWGWARYPRTAGERPCPRCVQGVTASNVLARSKDCPCAQPRQQGAPARRLAGSGLTGSWEEWKSSGPERTLSAGLPEQVMVVIERAVLDSDFVTFKQRGQLAEGRAAGGETIVRIERPGPSSGEYGIGREVTGSIFPLVAAQWMAARLSTSDCGACLLQMAWQRACLL